MISAFVLLAAAAAPPPEKPVGLFSVEDYPPDAMKRGEQGRVYFELVVNPEGRVDRCTILVSSGSNDLDTASCRIVLERARFSPARDEAGRAIYSTYRQAIVWRLDNRGASAPLPPLPDVPPDFDLTLNQAPAGVKLPVQFKVTYFVKANGTASHCQASDSAKPPPQMLLDLACKAVMQQPIEVIRNRDNKPVDASNGETVVRFSLDKRKR